jgi:anti-sigma factor ChrR (cupin superfamily)
MNPELPHGGPEEWAALYAAGAMTPAERQAFEALLAEGCHAFDAELKHFDTVVTALSQAVPPVQPRASTKAALMDRIAADKARSQVSPSPGAAHTPVPAGFFFQHAADAVWKPTKTPGVQIRLMYVDNVRERATACLRMEPGRHYPHHEHLGVEEVFVLEGDLRLGDIVMRAGDYQRAEGGTHHEDQYTENGCVVLIHMPLAVLSK